MPMFSNETDVIISSNILKFSICYYSPMYNNDNIICDIVIGKFNQTYFCMLY